MNSTPQDSDIMDGLMGKRLVEWNLVEDSGLYLTLSDGTILFCFGVGIVVNSERMLQ